MAFSTFPAVEESETTASRSAEVEASDTTSGPSLWWQQTIEYREPTISVPIVEAGRLRYANGIYPPLGDWSWCFGERDSAFFNSIRLIKGFSRVETPSYLPAGVSGVWDSPFASWIAFFLCSRSRISPRSPLFLWVFQFRFQCLRTNLAAMIVTLGAWIPTTLPNLIVSFWAYG